MLCCGSAPDVPVVPEAAVSADSSHSHILTAVTPASVSLTPLLSAGSTCPAQGPLTHNKQTVNSVDGYLW